MFGNVVSNNEIIQQENIFGWYWCVFQQWHLLEPWCFSFSSVKKYTSGRPKIIPKSNQSVLLSTSFWWLSLCRYLYLYWRQETHIWQSLGFYLWYSGIFLSVLTHTQLGTTYLFLSVCKKLFEYNWKHSNISNHRFIRKFDIV